MGDEEKTKLRLEIAHVLFLDIIGYSKLLITEQSELLRKLTSVVRETEQFRLGEAEGTLVRLPTGDGMALVFRSSPEAPAECALELSKRFKTHPELQVRMGIHSGPVNEVADVNERTNITGAGINMAQRVMDCGDAGHILLSKHVADDLEQYPQWRAHLHELGECEVKHGVRISVVNLYTDDLGNPEVPDKFKKAPQTQTTLSTSVRPSLVAIVSLIALAIVALISVPVILRSRGKAQQNDASLPNERLSIPIPEKSIAVLPFENLSEDKANAYFADGIQDEILTRLAKIADLKVISRTSTQHYKSAPENLPEIAKQLGVAIILEGSVQKSGDAVRVNVQLIKAAGDFHLWAETYDRKLTDIFAVETEVAQRIATSLESKLTGREREAISYVGTKIPAAYDAYLRGMALQNTQTREDQDRLIQFCRQAVALDPNYAAAWAQIAVAEGVKYFQGGQSEAQRARTEEAAANALRLDPEHGNGHRAWGFYLYICLQEYDQALSELQQARQQAPNDAFIILSTALVKRRQGKLDETIEILLQAAQLDPLNQDIWSNLGQTYRGMRKLEEARAMYDRALAIAPNDRGLRVGRAYTYILEGDLTTAEGLYRELQIPFMARGYRRALTIFEFQRQYDAAIAKISADLEREKLPAPFILAIMHLTLGALHTEAGRGAQAKPLLTQAEEELKALREQGNISPDLLGSLLQAEAFLGRREEVERQAAEFIASQAKDRWSGPYAEQAAARAYMRLGEKERAIAILERLMAEPSDDSWTAAILRMDPVWDPIRDDSRFQKLAASLESKP